MASVPMAMNSSRVSVRLLSSLWEGMCVDNNRTTSRPSLPRRYPGRRGMDDKRVAHRFDRARYALVVHVVPVARSRQQPDTMLAGPLLLQDSYQLSCMDGAHRILRVQPQHFVTPIAKRMEFPHVVVWIPAKFHQCPADYIRLEY